MTRIKRSSLTAISKNAPDWEIVPLLKYASCERGAFTNGPFGSNLLSSELTTEGVPVVYIRDICDGRYVRKSKVCVTEEKANELSACRTEYGDVIITKVGDPPCEAAFYSDECPAVITQDVIRIKTGDPKQSSFVVHLLNSEVAMRQIKKIKIEGTRDRVSLTDFKKIKVPQPSYVEREAIGLALSAWDCAIEKTEAIIEAKEWRKAGLMQRLLTGKVRFGEFAGEAWKEMSIGKLLRQVKRPVVWDDGASYKLLSLRRASGGLFHRQTLRGSEILTKKMNTALEGDFLISKMQVVHGATGLTTAEFDGYHVSNSYLSYVARDPSTLDIRFFNWLCKTKEMYHKAYRSSYGVHIEKMTFNPKLWLKETIMLPPTTEEQAKIVEVLDTSVAEIEEHRTQLAALKEQKKGLMQQLLTGKVRVNAKE